MHSPLLSKNIRSVLNMINVISIEKNYGSVDFLSGKYQDPIAVSEIIVTKKLKTG